MSCKIWGSITLVLKIPFFWDVILCSWASSSLQFEGLKCLHLQGQAVNNMPSKLQELLTQCHSITSRRISASAGTAVWTSNITRLIMFTASFHWSDVWTVTEELHFRRAVAGYREADHKCNDHIWGQLRISGVTTMQNNRVGLKGILSSRIMTTRMSKNLLQQAQVL